MSVTSALSLVIKSLGTRPYGGQRWDLASRLLRLEWLSWCSGVACFICKQCTEYIV